MGYGWRVLCIEYFSIRVSIRSQKEKKIVTSPGHACPIILYSSFYIYFSSFSSIDVDSFEERGRCPEAAGTRAMLRHVTLFLALHDIDDEAMGPTRFWPKTHAPRCFPDERWLPPTEALAAERSSCWIALRAGDGVLMDSLTWHCGGANSSGRRRTMLSASFVEPAPERRGSGGASSSLPRLGDFRGGSTYRQYGDFH